MGNGRVLYRGPASGAGPSFTAPRRRGRRLGYATAPFLFVTALVLVAAGLPVSTHAFAATRTDMPTLSPDVVSGPVAASSEAWATQKGLGAVAIKARDHLRRVARATQETKPTREYVDWEEALTNLATLAEKGGALNQAAGEKLEAEKAAISGVYPPRDALAGLTLNASETVENGTGAFVQGEAAYRAAIEQVDHAAQVAGEATYQANVGEEKTIKATEAVMDTLHSLSVAKEKTARQMVGVALKALAKTKILLHGAQTRNTTLVTKGQSTPDTLSKAAADVRRAEEIVVRGETAVREAEANQKLARLVNAAAMAARTAQTKLKDVTVRGATLDAAANEANIVANQDDLVNAALSSKGDADAARNLLTQSTPPHEKLRAAAKAAEAFRPGLLADRAAIARVTKKALLTADAQLDAEERAAKAVEKVGLDMKELRPRFTKDFLALTLDKTLEKREPESVVDQFDIAAFRANHTAAHDPSLFASAVMDELTRRAALDLSSGNLAPLVAKPTDGAAAPPVANPEETDTLSLLTWARGAQDADLVLSKNASAMTKHLQSLVVSGAPDELSSTVRVNVAQENEEAHLAKLRADDAIFGAAQKLLAALRKIRADEVATKLSVVEHERAAMADSVAVVSAHKELDRVVEAVAETNLTEKETGEKVWRYRITESAAHVKLAQSIRALVADTNRTNTLKARLYHARAAVAEAKLQRLKAIMAIKRHEARLATPDTGTSLKEPPLANTSATAKAVQVAEYDVATNARFAQAFEETAILRYESQLRVAELAMKKSVLLTAVASRHSPVPENAPAVNILNSPTGAMGATGVTGGDGQNVAPEASVDDAVGKSATGAAAGLDDDGVQTAEGQLDADITRLMMLSSANEKLMVEAQKATQEADLASYHIIEEENDRNHAAQLVKAGAAKAADTSMLAAVMPAEGVAAAKKVMEDIFQTRMTDAKVLNTMEE